MLVNGATIEGEELVPLETLIERGHHIAENLEVMSGSLRDILSGEDTKGMLKKTIANLAKITDSLEKGLGGDEADLGRAIKNLDESAASLKVLLDKVNQGEGTVGKLLTKDELYQDLRSFIAEIKAHPWRLMKRDNDGKKFLVF